ncbi:MAG TPA: hypothetical protein VMQ83_02140, partial [Gammaproteobacteria bacterium]|nr:hypothetical protein [Gammaproteobacteria bacterium]
MRLAAIALLSVLFVAGCASSAGPANSARQIDRDVLSREEILQTGSRNVYDAILALRRNWLVTRGVDSLNNPVQVQVYLDDSRLAGVETLRQISVIDLDFVRYYNGREASVRWGLNHGQGAIYVATIR